ncbi:MAG: hypothetical protein AABY22_20835, partial [Nanoarchaeota archaeon]
KQLRNDIITIKENQIQKIVLEKDSSDVGMYDTEKYKEEEGMVELTTIDEKKISKIVHTDLIQYIIVIINYCDYLKCPCVSLFLAKCVENVLITTPIQNLDAIILNNFGEKLDTQKYLMYQNMLSHLNELNVNNVKVFPPPPPRTNTAPIMASTPTPNPTTHTVTMKTQNPLRYPFPPRSPC